MNEEDIHVTQAQVDAAMERSRRDSTAEGVAQGLDLAKATIAEIWRNTLDDDRRYLAMRALSAVIAAEQTMHAAEDFLLARTKSARLEAFDKLRRSCCLRIGHDVRSRP